MKIKNFIEKFDLKVLSELYEPESEVSGGYTSDLLSDVIANSKKDNVWITMQTHLNIVAVASLKELSAIIIVMNREIDKDALEKAREEKILILSTNLTAFQISGKIYESGIK
ncbi:MAG: serine kinase [Ignavibacteriae bacterium]|nr:serine kinase [Ignavibacteriota bacterium]